MIAILSFLDYDPRFSPLEKGYDTQYSLKVFKEKTEYNKKYLERLYNILEDLNAFDVVTIKDGFCCNSCDHWLYIDAPKEIIDVLAEEDLITICDDEDEEDDGFTRGDDR